MGEVSENRIDVSIGIPNYFFFHPQGTSLLRRAELCAASPQTLLALQRLLDIGNLAKLWNTVCNNSI